MNLFEKLKKKESLKKGAATALAATVLAGSMNAAIKNDSLNENNNDIDAMKQPEPPKTVSSVSAKSNFTGSGSDLYKRTVEANSFVVKYQKEIGVKWDEEMATEVVEFMNGEYPTVMNYMGEDARNQELEKITNAIGLIIAGNLNMDTSKENVVDLAMFIKNQNDKELVNEVMNIVRTVGEMNENSMSSVRQGYTGEYILFIRRLLIYETEFFNRDDYLNSTPNIRFLISNAFQNINNAIPHGISAKLDNGEDIYLRYFIDQEKNTMYCPMDADVGVVYWEHDPKLNEKDNPLNIVSGSYSEMEMLALGGVITAEDYEKYTNKNFDGEANTNLVEKGLIPYVDAQVEIAKNDFLDLNNVYGKIR